MDGNHLQGTIIAIHIVDLFLWRGNPLKLQLSGVVCSGVVYGSPGVGSVGESSTALRISPGYDAMGSLEGIMTISKAQPRLDGRINHA